jgi:hypothetical protein
MGHPDDVRHDTDAGSSSLPLTAIPPYNRLGTPFLRRLDLFLRHWFGLEQSAQQIIEFSLFDNHPPNIAWGIEGILPQKMCT